MPALQFPNTDAAIAQFEGFGQSGTLATKNNNPGNLVWGQFALLHGASGIDPRGFAIFPDSDTGSAAEDALVSYYANQHQATIAQLIGSWAPPTAPGNSAAGTASYTDFVANALHATPDTLVTAAENGITQNQASPKSTSFDPSTILSQIPGLLGSAATGGIFSPSGIVSVWGRVAAFALGFVLIAGGIYLFRPVQKAVNTVVKKAATKGVV